jgi:signal peptidase I
MLQLVDDSRYRSEALTEIEWPLNWQAEGEVGGWTSPDDGKTYVCPVTDETAWLHFRQYYLDFSVWEKMGSNIDGKLPPLEGIRPIEIPITDFYAYNAQTRRLDSRGLVYQQPEPIGMHWVGDLAVEADVEIESEGGLLELVLVEAGRLHRCKIDLATGQATLDIDEGRVPFRDGNGDTATELTTETPIRGAGRYRLRFSNVDNQLTLWVNNKLCNFAQDAIYGPTLQDRPRTGPADPGDLHPVRLGARQAAVTIRRLRVLRDIYYIATNSELANTTDYPPSDAGQRAIQHLIRPQRWAEGDLFDRRKTVEFTMKKDQFFALGDNSPYSRDSRLWGREHYVERDMLIGKAVLIYWPHAWRIGIPGTGISLPIIPNVQNMGLIH